MTFALVVYYLVAGQVHAAVLDSGLSYEDCREAAALGVSGFTDNAGRLVTLPADAATVCELETD